MASRRSGTSLFVRNVPDEARADDLRDLFDRYGSVRDIYIPQDYYTKRPRGFAYVEFEDGRDAEEALYRCGKSGKRLFGRELHIEMAAGNRKSPTSMRDKYGGPYDSPRRRSRSRSRSPRRRRDRSRSDSRERDRRRHKRSRSRSRDRRRSRSRSRDDRKSSGHKKRRDSRSSSPDDRKKNRSRSRSRSKSYEKDDMAQNGKGRSGSRSD